MSRRPHRPWTNLALCGFGAIPIVFRQSVGWRTPFRVVISGVPPKEEFQSRALRKSEGTTRTIVKNWGLGAWQAQYAVSSSSHLEALPEDWAKAEGHNVCLPPMWLASNGGATLDTLVSTTLNIIQLAYHKVSCHRERVLISASFSNMGSDWR